MKPKITYHKNGQIETEAWKNEDGKRHRLDGPAFREWYRNGQLRWEEWCINGSRHRLDGPAQQEWSERGQLWNESWYINGEPHRLDGPAQRWYKNGQVWLEQWYINGVLYKTEAEFLVAVDLYKANEIAELF